MQLNQVFTRLAAVLCLVLMVSEPAYAYIGPGAGFAFLGSAFVFILTIGMAILTISLWPLQLVWKKLRGKGISRKARARRVVIVGLDGLEPKLADQYMAQGLLPNLKALAETGSYSRLGTTLPALSPVAWSSFQTGVNPGAHNIFDFLSRDKRVYMPVMTSTDMQDGKLVITRKSQPFWKILGKHGVFSNVIRVPISYPPEKFEGNILSAMCTPDLKGSQGSFLFFSSQDAVEGQQTTGGQIRKFKEQGDLLCGEIEGPPDPSGKGYLTVNFTLKVDRAAGTAVLQIGKESEVLAIGKFSRWIELNFRYGRKNVSGIARFCLRGLSPEVALYVSPVNANPENPALKIAHPIFFSTWLAKRQGPFGTLGLLEDTWGRNELALDDQAFLDQSYLTHDERERMLFDAIDRTREGVCICVFDATDRIQHMFWRYLDPKHPSPRETGKDFSKVIPDLYQKMDALIGRVQAKLKPEDLLIVISDHGFASFRRCVCLNRWLYEQGYLAVKGEVTGSDYFKDVDWDKTKAFALGLSGIYINKAGRELRGIVEEQEAEKLKKEISAKLEALVDPQDGARAISKVHDTAVAYRGLYTDEAPDLIVGYNPGYRISWESITGTIEPQVFADNLKAWSGDHHVDPQFVPGVFFANRPLKEQNPKIIDIAPTMLDLFALKVPGYMEGKVIL